MDRWSRRQVVQGVGVAGLGLLAGCAQRPRQGQPPRKFPHIGVLVNNQAPADLRAEPASITTTPSRR